MSKARCCATGSPERGAHRPAACTTARCKLTCLPAPLAPPPPALLSALLTALLVALLPAWAVAKGGSMQPKPNKDFRELIVKGERPEIAACLVAAIDYARRDPTYGAIRWDDNASDRAIMRETDDNGRLTRHVRLTAQLRIQGAAPFGGSWRSFQVSCEQPPDGGVQVRLSALGS
jgi:hypothetical protein